MKKITLFFIFCAVLFGALLVYFNRADAAEQDTIDIREAPFTQMISYLDGTATALPGFKTVGDLRETSNIPQGNLWQLTDVYSAINKFAYLQQPAQDFDRKLLLHEVLYNALIELGYTNDKTLDSAWQDILTRAGAVAEFADAVREEMKLVGYVDLSPEQLLENRVYNAMFTIMNKEWPSRPDIDGIRRLLATFTFVPEATHLLLDALAGEHVETANDWDAANRLDSILLYLQWTGHDSMLWYQTFNADETMINMIHNIVVNPGYMSRDPNDGSFEDGKNSVKPDPEDGNYQEGFDDGKNSVKPDPEDGSYQEGYDKGREDGIAGVVPDPGDGAYEDGYNQGYQDAISDDITPPAGGGSGGGCNTSSGQAELVWVLIGVAGLCQRTLVKMRKRWF